MADKNATTLTVERAREVFRYDPESGRLFWRKRLSSRVLEGQEAGGLYNPGNGLYRRVRADNRVYAAHRVIWLIMTGKWPSGEVDHIDGDGTNNRWANLRDASRSVNARNLSLRSDNRSGCHGVSWNSERQRWDAYIKDDKGRRHRLGRFVRVEDAIEARRAAEREFGYHENHGRAGTAYKPAPKRAARGAERGTKEVRTCPACGGAFEAFASVVKECCSRECSNKLKKAARLKRLGRECAVCGTRFVPKHSKSPGLYCSYKCSGAANRKDWKARKAKD